MPKPKAPRIKKPKAPVVKKPSAKVPKPTKKPKKKKEAPIDTQVANPREAQPMPLPKKRHKMRVPHKIKQPANTIRSFDKSYGNAEPTFNQSVSFYCHVLQSNRSLASCALGLCGERGCPFFKDKETQKAYVAYHNARVDMGKPPVLFNILYTVNKNGNIVMRGVDAADAAAGAMTKPDSGSGPTVVDLPPVVDLPSAPEEKPKRKRRKVKNPCQSKKECATMPAAGSQKPVQPSTPGRRKRVEAAPPPPPPETKKPRKPRSDKGVSRVKKQPPVEKKKRGRPRKK